jgi:hypothetical protein
MSRDEPGGRVADTDVRPKIVDLPHRAVKQHGSRFTSGPLGSARPIDHAGGQDPDLG